MTKSSEDTIIVSAVYPYCINTIIFQINPITDKIAKNPINLKESEWNLNRVSFGKIIERIISPFAV